MSYNATESSASVINRNGRGYTNNDISPQPFLPGDRTRISRTVQVIKQYLEQSNDVNTAVGCLETLIRVGSTFNGEGDAIHQQHVLETITVVIDVLRNHQRSIDISLTRKILEYVDKLDIEKLFAIDAPDVKFAFLVKYIRSALRPSLQPTQQRDNFDGLIFDVASVLISQCKYDVSKCITFLEKSKLDWFTCWQIIKSVLLQHTGFSRCSSNTTDALYMVLDLKAAVGQLETLSPPCDRIHETPLPIDNMSRLNLIAYCTLEAAQRMLTGLKAVPGNGFFMLSESILATTSRPLRFKAVTLLCTLQSLADSLLNRDTMGYISLDSTELASLLHIRESTAQFFAIAKSNEENSQRQLMQDLVKRRTREDTIFAEQITSPTSPDVDAAHLAIIKLDDWMTRRQMTLSQRVREYFQKNELEPLLCPISERPMTDAIYLRCGKTVNQAALEELVAGNIPESHCCCEEIHVDIAHKLHNCPLVSDLAIRHLRQALDVPDIVRYGDLPTLRFAFSDVRNEDKLALLRISISTKNTPIATFLLNSGVDPNASYDDTTPLIAATSTGSTELVMALLHNGARPDYRDSKDSSALIHAAAKNYRSIIEILFTKMTGLAMETAMSCKTALSEKLRENCATAFHDLWLGFEGSDNPMRILYLQRAMELDPENHLYAEEMQSYLDDQERRQPDRVYVSYIDDEGHLYEGFIVHGFRSGAGKLTYSKSNEDLESFDGEWENNAKKNGLLKYRDGSQYHGDISSSDERHGQGILYLPTGSWYEGGWIHNEMHGHGKYCFENGDVYEGSFEYDTLSGHGKLLHPDGDYYDGMWKNGLKHGFGIYDLDSTGLKYEGFWIKDKKHGSGWIIYPDGTQYKGEFIDDEPIGDEGGEPIERRHSTDNRLAVNRKSVESFKTEHSPRSATTPLSPKRLENVDRKLRHERSRSFLDTVGRRI